MLLFCACMMKVGDNYAALILQMNSNEIIVFSTDIIEYLDGNGGCELYCTDSTPEHTVLSDHIIH